MDIQTTSTLSLNSLPADLLFQILKYSFSMDDFSAVIRTSRRIYAVYKDSPGSILRSVACHQLGMTKEIFPLAFGLVLHHERARECDPPVKDWLGDGELSASRLNPSRFRTMKSNHEVVKRLEKEFSRSYKDSRFGYSVLSSVEAHRFQSSAYLFWQFQVLFGIDTSAKVLPWEYDEPTPEDQLLTRQSFLERIPAMSRLHLSAFKDYLLKWAEDNYQTLEDEGLIEEYLIDLTREQGCHLLLSAGLDHVDDDSEPCEIFDMVEGFNQKYARLQLWFTEDLDPAIAPGAIPHVKNADDAKLVVRQGPIYTKCQRCTYETKQLYNATNYSDITGLNGVHLSGHLSSNEIETDRLKTCFRITYQTINVPDELHRELLWPSHMSLSPFDYTTDGQSNANETVPAIVAPSPDRISVYIYDPWHMLCVSCLRDVLRSKFWSWWEVHRKLPPVNAPDQPDCWYGLNCRTQRRTDHAKKYNHWYTDIRDM